MSGGPTINFSGLASGIDTNSLIDATSAATRQTREQPKKDKIDELSKYNSALDDLATKLDTFKSAAESMNSISGGAVAKSASSSAETIVTADVSNGAVNGSYSLSVTQVAKAESYSFDWPYASSSDIVASVSAPGDITFPIGTSNPENVVVTVTPTMTVSQFIAAFNSASTRAEASLVQVGTNDYRILITSNKTGTAEGAMGIITRDGGVFSGNKLNPAGGQFTEDAAQDASFTLNGIGPFTRSTNTVNDVITGVTFNLISAPGSATITISDDEPTTASTVKKFVDAYNEIITYFNSNNGISSSTDQAGSTVNVFGSLATDRTDDSSIEILRAALSSIRYSSSSAVAIPADLGFSTQRDGTLKFDEKVFKTALSTDPAAVSQLTMSLGDKFGGTYSGTTGNGVVDSITGFNRLYDTTKNGNNTLIDDLNEQISEIEKQISQTEQDMRIRFATLESTMAKLQSQQQQLTSSLAGLR